MKKIKWILFLVIALILAGCSTDANTSSVDMNESSISTEGTYEQIDVETAKELMDTEDDYLIVDVRTSEEYSSGHIPNSINVPNETISEDAPDMLPDKEQLLLVYCRSGNRSKQASQKLADLGYTNVKEFGGIISWDGEIVTE